MTIIPFDDRAPTGPVVTSYDERHRATYWRLLDAARVDSDWREVVTIVFGIDAAIEAERAWSVYETHLVRARWLSETGYRHYLRQPDQ